MSVSVLHKTPTYDAADHISISGEAEAGDPGAVWAGGVATQHCLVRLIVSTGGPRPGGGAPARCEIRRG